MKFYIEIDGLEDDHEVDPAEVAEAIEREIGCLRLSNGDLLYVNLVRVDPIYPEDEDLEGDLQAADDARQEFTDTQSHYMVGE